MTSVVSDPATWSWHTQPANAFLETDARSLQLLRPIFPECEYAIYATSRSGVSKLRMYFVVSRSRPYELWFNKSMLRCHAQALRKFKETGERACATAAGPWRRLVSRDQFVIATDVFCDNQDAAAAGNVPVRQFDLNAFQ